MWFALKIAVFSLLVISSRGTDNEPQIIPSGDPRSCQLAASYVGRFEDLPGVGWDNLRNVAAGQIVSYKFTECQTTHDGRYLVPDNVNTIPLKTSNVEKFAEMIDHWKNYTSTTSRGVNVDAGLSFHSVGISGHFSYDYQHVKSQQINDNSVTTRVQLRYVRYKAILQPDSPFHPAFKQRLVDVASQIQLNNTAQARYQTQLIIRDFGTHVIRSVDVGAVLEQQDQIQRSYVNKYESNKSKIAAGASASFFNFFHFGASYTNSVTKEEVDEYRKSRIVSKVESHGGPSFQAMNYTVNDWTADIDKELVAVDRSGDPISYLITPRVLPELPTSVLNELQVMLATEIQLYYEYNAYRGCMTLGAPNFSPVANLDDGSCKAAPTNMTFGGVFQTCSVTPGSNDGDICTALKLKQVNPSTGDYSCPPNYEAVKLHSGSISKSRSERSCHSCWLFCSCCHTNYYHSGASYYMYWCAATGPVPSDSGYLFGGLYTTSVANIQTGAQTCPKTFYPRQLSTDLFICISDDFEQGAKYALPFGGFMSCSTGNPLAVGKTPKGNKVSALASFYRDSNPTDWPRHCPDGFSKHLAYMDQQCEINYCLRTGSLSGPGLPPVRRPPFVSPPARIGLPTNYVKFDPLTQTWIKNNLVDGDDEKQNSNSNSMSSGAVAAVSVVGTLAFATATVIVLFLLQKRRNKKNTGPTHASPRGYGAISDEEVSVNIET